MWRRRKKDEAEGHHWGTRLLCIGLFVFGCVVFVIDAAMNIDFRWSIGASDRGRLYQAAGALAGVGMAPVMSFVAGVMARHPELVVYGEVSG